MKLTEMLDFAYQPVGVWFADEKPQDAYVFDPDKRPCVVSMMLAAAKGRTVAASDETCPCPGGAVGLGFGDAFTRRDAPTMWMLAHGEECPDWPQGRTLPPHLKPGERFFCSSQATCRWREELKLSDADYTWVVFRPLEQGIQEAGEPDLVWMLANPDQLSALVIMCGYSTGRALNVDAPFCAGCQSLVLARQQIGAQEPRAILGMFDISQRHRLPKELLSLTVPYALFADIDAHCAEGCLATHAWQQIADRYR